MSLSRLCTLSDRNATDALADTGENMRIAFSLHWMLLVALFVSCARQPPSADNSTDEASIDAPQLVRDEDGDTPRGMNNGEGRYRVVFESKRNGAFASTVFSVNPDGTDETRLSRHETGRPLILDTRVSWDGARIAFTRGGSDHRTGIWTMNSDGSGEEEIIERVAIRFDGGWAKPSLSPDNQEMVYVSNLHGRDDIFRTSIQAKEPIRLTTQGEYNRLPRWSPDGNWIAYVSKVGQNRNIMLMKTDGSESHAITSSDSDDTMPDWMPDSQELVFVSDRDGPTDLYVVSLTGDDVRRLSDTVDLNELNPTVSPDGTMIAFEAKPPDAEEPWLKSIYVMPFDDGSAVKLTSSEHSDTSPSWITNPK